MNILILGLGFKKNDTTYELVRIKEEFEKRGHNVFISLWSDILFRFENNQNKITANKKDVAEFDYVICRYPLSTTTMEPTPEIVISSFLVRMYKHFIILVDYANQNNANVLNQEIISKMHSYDKMTQHYILNKNNLPTLKSFLYTGYNQQYINFKKPFIAKTIEGSRGVEVFLIETDKDLQNIIEKYGPGNILIQEFIPNRKDYRIITIGDKVIGGVLCINNDNDFRTNMMTDSKRKKISITPAMESIALSAKNAMNAEFTGIDIIEFNNQYYILEVNVFPMFMGFEQATNINVVEKLAENIEKIHNLK